MTDKELRKLKRREILQLLLTEVQEAADLQEQLAGAQSQIQELEEGLDHLKKRLDQKDIQIERLKKRLDQKDTRLRELRELIDRYAKNRRIELEEAGNIAEASLRLSDVFQEAQKAAEQYLYNISLRYGGEPDEDELDTERLDQRLAQIDEEDRREAEEEARIAMEEKSPDTGSEEKIEEASLEEEPVKETVPEGTPGEQ